MMSMARQYANCRLIDESGAYRIEFVRVWEPYSYKFGTDETEVMAFNDGSWYIEARHHEDLCKIIADDEMRLVLEVEKARINYPIQAENVVRELTDEFRRIDPAAMRRAVKCAG